MTFRLLILATVFIAGSIYAALAQSAATQAGQETWSVPAVRSSVTITGDIVHIGDVVDNAGAAAHIAIFRAPDLGTTGSLPTSQLIAILRTHQVIGVDTRNLREISVTRASRTVSTKDIELQVARALQRRHSLGDTSSLFITLDRDLRELQLDASSSGDMKPAIVRFDSRTGRFDVTFEVENSNSGVPTRVRFTGTAVETVEAAVLTRNTERNEILKASDIAIERRPKAEAGTDAANRDRAVGMQTRRQLRAGQILKAADLAKPDLVTRDQSITVIYETPGIYLTSRGKALENGTEGDTVSVLNPQSKRTIQGVVTGPAQVSVIVATPRAITTTASLATNSTNSTAATSKAE